VGVEQGQAAKDVRDREVLSAYAPVAPLGWLMFVELPVEEAYAPLWAATERSGLLLMAGLALASAYDRTCPSSAQSFLRCRRGWRGPTR